MLRNNDGWQFHEVYCLLQYRQHWRTDGSDPESYQTSD
jgi:hypothetical protein